MTLIKLFFKVIELKKLTLFLLVILFFEFINTNNLNAQKEDLKVIGSWLQYSDSPNALYHHLSSQAFEFLAERSAEVGKVTTKEQWTNRQKKVRKTLMDIVGPFPKKTPLNAKVVGIIKKDGYHIEKIIYESMPQFYVTSFLFVPENLKGKTPAILFVSGHSKNAVRRPLYQQVVLNLVKKGFIVLAIDPVGQGERLQYYDPEKKESRIGGPTKEHSYPGAQCFISGNSLARYMIWDGIRAIDYLVSRKEVDPKRIGCHGLSGGGTQSSYIAAFDKRILAVAPAGYITSFKRLFESIGPQDAEQNFYHGIASGIDHADLLEVRAPKPALIVATTCDFFSIQGSRETFSEIKRAYNAYGKEENISMVEDDYEHGYTRKNREAINAFFQKYLDLPGDSSDEDVPFLTMEELTVTTTGQISTALGGNTVFSLNKKETENSINKLENSRKNLSQHLEYIKSSAKELSGYVRPLNAGEEVFTGRYQRDGYSIEKYFIQGEGDYPIPFLMMVPDERRNHQAIIYLHPDDKAKEASIGGEMEWFVKQGYLVISPDLIGTGEMRPWEFKGDAYVFKTGKAHFNTWFASIQIGRSIVGIRAGDIIRITDWIQSREDIKCEKILAVARGEMCPVLLHSAAFEKSISGIALIEPFVSYRSMVMNPYYNVKYAPVAVAGALIAYDLPDLAASLAPRNLLIINSVDQNGKPAKPELLDKDLSIVRSAYFLNGTPENFEIRKWEPCQSMNEVFSKWLR